MSNFDFDHTQCSFNVWFSMIYFVANISRKKIAVAYAMNKFSSCRTANNSIWLYMEIWAYYVNRIKSAMRFYAVMRKILMCVVYFLCGNGELINVWRLNIRDIVTNGMLNLFIKLIWKYFGWKICRSNKRFVCLIYVYGIRLYYIVLNEIY